MLFFFPLDYCNLTFLCCGKNRIIESDIYAHGTLHALNQFSRVSSTNGHMF